MATGNGDAKTSLHWSPIRQRTSYGMREDKVESNDRPLVVVGGEVRSRAARRSDRSNAPAARRKYRMSRYARRRKSAGVALIACLLVVGAVYFLAGGDDEINRGVSIGSVDVGGMTRDEAREAVQADASATFEKISFGTGKEEFSVSGEDLGIRVDAASAVDEAYSVGRRGNMFQHLSDTLRSHLGGVRVDLDAGYDKDKARGVLEERAEEFNEKPQDASFSVTDSGKVVVEEAKKGRVMDQQKTLANLEGALKNLSGHVAIAEGPAPEPDVSTAEVQRYRPKEVIGEYQTDFLWDSNPNRKSNMKLAAASVNNTVLKPGEVLRDGFLYTYRYSFNPPTPENAPHYKTTAPRVAGWSDPTNTTGWASPR